MTSIVEKHYSYVPCNHYGCRRISFVRRWRLASVRVLSVKCWEDAGKCPDAEIDYHPTNSEFLDFGYMQHVGPGWRVTNNLLCHIHYVPMQKTFKGFTECIYVQSLFYLSAVNQKVTASGSVYSSSFDR